MASLSNSRWLNSKERPNSSTNNGDMAEIAKRPLNDDVIKRVAELIKIQQYLIRIDLFKKEKLDNLS